MTNYSFKRISLWVFALLTILLLGVTDAHASGSAYSRARAYLRSDAPSGSGKVYVGQAATSSPNYQTSSSSEKQGEKTTTTYHFYAQAATGYKFTGWYSKNANDEYVAASNSTVSGTTYTYTDTHYVVNVTSGSNPSSGSSYTDKDLYAGFIKIVQLSFIRPEDGSFTIMHNGAAVADYASFTVDGKVVLTATPDAGYKLRGWYTTTDGGVTKNYFAFAEEIEPSLTTNVTIGAEFVLDDGKADFWVKGTTTTYNDLNAANTAAAATSAKTIVLVNSGTLPAGTYTISSGVTLLIPYGSDYSKIDQPNIVHVTGIGSAPALSVYKKLSLAAGATINCSGKICVGGQMMSINGGNPTSVVRGRAGVLDLSRGGLINLNSGSALYAWGFVQGQDIDQGNNTSGVGTIDAKSGSTVWEVFQCGEWRGGTASSTIYSNRSSWKFFPFQSYTVQNIEAPITYRYGATGKCKWTIFGDGKIYTVDFTLIGSSNALFNMGSGATLNKRYDATTDRICYELNGTNAVNALSLSAMGETINSSEYRLPIPANMQITVTGGTTSISNQMVLHAGAYVDIRSGATLNINTNVYIFDQTDWDTYCMYAYYYRSYASLTKHYNRGDGTSKATLEDATVIVDGNLTFGGSGRLYSTTNGANIKGNNGGRITFGTLPTQTTIVMCKKLSDAVNVNVSSANMHNIDDSYTKAVASTTFHNVNGRWFAAADKDPKADHTYKFTYIKSGAVYGTGGTNATVNTLYRSGWIDVKADVCDDWWQGLNDTYLYNYTFNNAWHQYEQTPTVIGEGEEAATIYSGTDGKLYAKTECTWEEYSGADENCLQTIGGVKKAFINGSFVALTKNTEDEAYHNTANATEYYICFKDICEWHPATKVAGANKAYIVTATSQKYIWYSGAWLAATQESPYFYTRSENGEKTYYEYVGSEWTEANVVAESTRNGTMTRYFNLSDAFTDANENTAPGESTTIKIMKSVTITSALSYTGNGTCTVDLNGFTLSGSINNMITINGNKAVLVVLDQSPEETGKISISYSAADTRRRAVYVQDGRLMLNSGTIQATNSQAQVDAIYVNANELCDINGGQVKATASSGAYGIHTAGGTARATIKGGTITASSPASKGVYSEGGEIRMSAGTVNATTTGTEAISLATTAASTSTINLTGGAVNATAANNAYGVQFGTSNHTGTATISGGTITANATTNTAYGIYSAGKTTVNGGKIYANATNYAYGAYGYSTNQLTINTTDTIHANATTRYAYGIRTYGQSGKLWVSRGVINVNTPNDAYGLYVERGTDTINGGEFLVRATGSSKYAYGLYMGTHTSVKCVVNGGKFKVTAASDAYARINTIASGGDITKLSLAGGYYSKEPQTDAYLGSGSCIAAGKEVKDLDATVEASLIAAGYTKKIAGTEYTVTWKNRGGAVIKTEKVESGKVPVYTGATPAYSDSWGTYEFTGWATTDGGEVVSPLPAIGASDVTYFARYRGVYAEVTIGGTTTKHYSVTTAWTAAMAAQQAYIKVLCSADNLNQLVFNPTPANAIITLDINGYHWGMNGSKDADKDCFIKVNKAGCKLIITDSRGGGYVHTQWAKASNLHGVIVSSGELLLQGGKIKCDNKYGDYIPDGKDYYSSYNSVGVRVESGAVLTMTGGTVEATKTGEATKGSVSGIYAVGTANLSGGRIYAHYAQNQAIGVYTFNTTGMANCSENLVVDATGGASVYGIHGYGTANIEGGTYNITATGSTARAIYPFKYSTYSGKVYVTGNPEFNVTAVSGAVGVYADGSDVEVEIDGGTFDIEATGGSNGWGVSAFNYATTTVKSGAFDVSVSNASYEQCWGAYASTNGIVNVEGGTFTVSPAKVGGNNDAVRCNTGADTRLNISGGIFTMTNGWNAVRSMGGKTTITGNPIFTARYGVNAGTWASATGTAEISIDGGTFICTAGSALVSKTHTYNGNTVTGDITVWDGRFFTQSGRPIDTSSGDSYLKIRGGYYSSYTTSNVSELDGYVVSPSVSEKKDTTIAGKAYTYRVNTKYNVTWSVNGNTTTQEYNRNETPSYGSIPTISDGNTREFLGWNTAVDGSGDTISPVTTDVTYYAVFRVWEAEVIEGEAATGTKFEHFMDAFNIAKNMPVAKIKMLSDVSTSTRITLTPDSVSGSKPLTFDLNNHTLAYTGTEDRFFVVNKTGTKLIITDNSLAQGGTIKYDGSHSSQVICVAPYYGTLELQGGKIFARNATAGKPAFGVYPCREAIFRMTGGTVEAYGKAGARGVYAEAGSTSTIDISGGSVLASTEYDNSGTPAWGNAAYGVSSTSGSTFTIRGTASITAHANQDAYGVYATGVSGNTSEVTIKGGSVNAIVETKRVFGAYAAEYGKINIEGGTVDGHSNVANTASMWNVEGAHCNGNAILNISGGEISSSNGASPIGVSVHGGTTTISGGKITSLVALYAVDYAAATQTAIVNVFGGTFIGTAEAVRVDGKVRDSSIKNNANVTINGGYFYSNGSRLVYLQNDSGAEPSTLVLNGGKYREKSGTTYKTQITALKGATTTINTISETVDGKTYSYELLTDFDITWIGGDSYSKVTQVKCGVLPSNDDLVGKCFIRNDSAFYFTGWSPTPSPVIGAITYQAVGDYYEAEVKIGSGAWTRYEDFLEAWDVVQANANCTIRLLSNLTLTNKILYKPTVANARTTFDLNNFTLTAGGTQDRFLEFNKVDAILTITDNSSAKGGKISMTRTSTASTYVVYVYNGELKMAGGKIYCQNNQNDAVWHPAIAVYVSNGSNAKLTMTGGTLESYGKYCIYPVYSYGTTDISGGTVKATATGSGSATPVVAYSGITTIRGTAHLVASTTTTANGASAGAWVSSDGKTIQQGTLNITGGTIDVTASTQSATGVSASAHARNVSGTVYAGHGTANISGGTITVKCSAATATQVFAAQCSETRIFDEETPHHLLGADGGRMNISGGTFLVDTRNNGAYVSNGGNIDLLRSWGTLNITGGTFTIYQNSGAAAIGTYRGKTTISGNPVFNVIGTTSSRGIIASPWNHSDYCDADATKNLTEIEVNGGTFNVKATSSNVIGAWAYGSISSSSVAGYAMSAKIVINGGEFICTAPSTVRCLYQYGPVSGTYGTVNRTLIVKGGKFKSQIATVSADGTIGAVTSTSSNIETGSAEVKLANLAGGYYLNNNQLAANVADSCVITQITSAEVDPEYNNGYRYRIDVDYRVKVTHGAIEHKFLNLNTALAYARTVANPTITLIGDADFTGPYSLNPSVANWRGTLDLNNFEINSTTSTDRFFTPARADAKLTITDNSVTKGGVWNLAYERTAGGIIGIVVDQGELILAGGKVHVENTASGKTATGVNIWGTSAKFTQTGGTLEVKAISNTATGVNMRGTTEVSGGAIEITSTGAAARGFILASDAGNSKYGSLTVSGSPSITVNGGSDVAGIYSDVAGTTTNVSGGTFDITAATTSAYGIRLAAASTATISGGTFNMTTSGNNSYGLHIQTAGTINVTGGTFNVTTTTDAVNSWYNIEGMRIYSGASSEINFSGGTFNVVNHSKTASASGVRTFSGTVNISGTATINANQCFRIVDQYLNDAAGTTAYVNVSGGTFNSNTHGIYTNTFTGTGANAGKVNTSNFTITGGQFKSTSANHIDATTPTSLLHIQGGFFNERSGTASKTNLAAYVSDPYEVFTLETGDSHLPTYAYEVCQQRVAKVETGGVRTYYTTVLAALNYAKTVANPTITILKDAPLTARWLLSDAIAGWQGILDLNGKTVTGTGTSYGIVDVTKAGTQLTIRDSSVGSAGKLTHEESQAAHWGINVNNGATLVLESGTIYVKNTKADVSNYTVGVCVNNKDGSFTQTGGKVEVHAARNVRGVYLYGSGTTTISGGEIEVATDLNPESVGNNAMAVAHDAASTLTINGTASLSATAASNAYGLYQNVASQTVTVGGSATIEVHAATCAYGVAQLKASTINIQGNADIQTTATTDYAYGVYQEKGATNVSASPSITVSAPTKAFAFYLQNSGTTLDVAGTGTYTASAKTTANGVQAISSASATLGGGTFTATTNITDGTYDAQALRIGSNALITVSGGTYTALAKTSQAQAVLATNNGRATITGGTFNANSTSASNGNVEVIRTWPGSVVNISGGTFNSSVSSSADAARALGGNLTISGGTFNTVHGVRSADADISATATATVSISGGTFNCTEWTIWSTTVTAGGKTLSSDFTVTGGKFKTSAANKPVIYNTNVNGLKIQGGYYSNNSNLETYCVAPKHAIATTAADKSVVGNDYNWKVVDAYTLTWTTDGDALTGTYTNGMTAVGASITAPNTPTKTGYTFASWSPAVAATMPAANTEYTATWNAAVASVTINGATTYHATLADAFEKANSAASAPTITLLQDISGITSALTYSAAQNCILDLNNHTVEAAVESQLININTNNKTFTITDGDGATSGKLYNEVNANTNGRYCVKVTKGHLILEKGTLAAKNTLAYNSSTAKSVGVAVVRVDNNANYKFTMNGGTLEAEATYRPYGIYSYGTTELNGGTIKATVPDDGYGTAYGVYATSNTTTIPSTSTIRIIVNAKASAIGLLAAGDTPASGTGAPYNGTINVEGGTFDVTTTDGASAFGVYATAATRLISGTYHHSYGTANISGGIFNVTSHIGTALGVYVTRKVVASGTSPNTVLDTCMARANISGGNFTIRTAESTGTTNAEGVRSYGSTIISGGSFDIKANTTSAYGVHVYAGKTTVNGTNNPSFTVRANSSVYGAIAAEAPDKTTGIPNDGELVINGGSFDVATTVKSATSNQYVYGVFANAGKRTGSGDTSGDYASAGTVTVNGGEFKVDGYQKVYGINYANTATEGEVSATAEMTINGGKFKVTGTTSSSLYAVNQSTAKDGLSINGGYYNINKYLSYNVVSPKKVLALRESHELYPAPYGYRYTVAQGGTVTWKNYDNSTLKTEDYFSGETPSYTGSTPTKPATAEYTYTHTGWTPTIVAMANANAAYTATYSQTENKYTVTISAEANGSASPASVSNIGCTTASGDITATPNTGYQFNGWTLPAGVTAAAGYSATSNPIRINATASGKTITATWTCVSPTSLSIASTGNKWDFCNGETMTLTVSGTNIATNATYQWQLGGVNIAGATGATYTTTMAAAKAGAYTCTVTNGSCSTTTGDYYVRVWQLYINNGTADAWQALDFANTGTNTGSNTTVALTSDKSYQFKLKDNTGGWFGLNSKTVTKTESAFALNGIGADVNVTSGMAGNYTFAINYSNKNNPTIAITYPTANQPNNRNIYFDKSVIADWGADIYYRIGHPTYNTNNSETGGTAWTLVPGTDNFYTTKTMAFDGFEAWQIANNKSWSGSNSIYKVDGTGYAITKATNFQKYVVGASGVTIVPTTSNNTENGCNYWNVAVTEGMLTHTATITAPTNGTITIANAAQSLSATATTADLPHRTILTVTATPATGYHLVSLTVNGAAFTSGNTHILSADATIAATFEATDIGFYADIVDVDNTNSKLIVNVTSWAANGWPYSINGTSYDKGARETDRTLKVPYVGTPGDNFAILVQKAGGDVVSHHTYVIPQEITSATSLTANETKSLYVKNTTLTINGSLTARNIYVAPDAKLVVNSGKTLTADTIFLRTTWQESAELENKGTIAGSTKVVYTRIIKDKDFHLFGLPLSCPVSSVRLSDGVVPMYTTGWVLRAYDEERRSNKGADDNNWTTLSAEGTIAGGAGYEMFSASAYYREFYFPVNLAELTNQVAVTYHLGEAGEKQAGWNAITSPFTHAYENAEVPEGLVVGWYQDGYGYYEQEIPTSIPPAYPFAIQATKNGYISFAGSSIVANAPRRVAAVDEEQQIQWIHLDITDGDGVGDQTSVYSHPNRYDAAFQTGIDVAKRSLTAARAIIYSSHAYGEMAFAGVADSLLEQGVALTVYSPKPQELTISMRDNAWLERLAEVWLIDVEAGAQIDLFDSDYTFEANEGTTRGRLFLQGRFKAPQIATDLEDVQTDNVQGIKAEKLIIRDKLYIRINGQLYDATGKQVKR